MHKYTCTLEKELLQQQLHQLLFQMFDVVETIQVILSYLLLFITTCDWLSDYMSQCVIVGSVASVSRAVTCVARFASSASASVSFVDVYVWNFQANAS